jgi:hypothetical protein
MIDYSTKPICEDAPCCGCCGRDRFEPDYSDESFDWDRWDYPEEEEEEEEEEV